MVVSTLHDTSNTGISKKNVKNGMLLCLKNMAKESSNRPSNVSISSSNKNFFLAQNAP